MSGEVAARVTCGDSSCVFVLCSSCGNCMWSTEPTVSQYYIIICNIIIIIIIINDLLVWDILNSIRHLHVKTYCSVGLFDCTTMSALSDMSSLSHTHARAHTHTHQCRSKHIILGDNLLLKLLCLHITQYNKNIFVHIRNQESGRRNKYQKNGKKQ
jgi:hypothetical protein